LGVRGQYFRSPIVSEEALIAQQTNLDAEPLGVLLDDEANTVLEYLCAGFPRTKKNATNKWPLEMSLVGGRHPSGL